MTATWQQRQETVWFTKAAASPPRPTHKCFCASYKKRRAGFFLWKKRSNSTASLRARTLRATTLNPTNKQVSSGGVAGAHCACTGRQAASKRVVSGREKRGEEAINQHQDEGRERERGESTPRCLEKKNSRLLRYGGGACCCCCCCGGGGAGCRGGCCCDDDGSACSAPLAAVPAGAETGGAMRTRLLPRRTNPGGGGGCCCMAAQNS